MFSSHNDEIWVNLRDRDNLQTKDKRHALKVFFLWRFDRIPKEIVWFLLCVQTQGGVPDKLCVVPADES